MTMTAHDKQSNLLTIYFCYSKCTSINYGYYSIFIVKMLNDIFDRDNIGTMTQVSVINIFLFSVV